MSPAERTFCLEIVTPEHRVCAVDARSVSFPATDGRMGVLANRAPLVAMVGAGEIVVEPVEGERHRYYIHRGFAQMYNNGLTVLAEECVPVDELDPEEAWEGIDEARRMPTQTADQLRRRDEALAAARERFRLAQRAARKRREAMGVETRTEGEDDWD